jgi:hypothetical protein
MERAESIRCIREVANYELHVSGSHVYSVDETATVVGRSPTRTIV